MSLSWTEILGFITGAVCVWLLVRQNIWTWPVGIANNVFFIVLFWRSQIYGDMALQFFYIAISIYGWWNWLHGGSAHSELRTQRTSMGWAAALTVITAFGTFILMALLRAYTNSSVPFLDALTTALSLTAQYMQSRKLMENWLVWITADLFYIYLYVIKGLYVTTLLYAIFLVMCIVGWTQWRRAYSREHALPLEVVAV
jgi:nicotinamide mononucleotide transporter